ncbi:MAG TPA: hypothetical protein VMS86_13285 [Thermoanaerobaculia bacterium]|nr:hypothetical protein [Thermoanaerobaculia bacterium]
MRGRARRLSGALLACGLIAGCASTPAPSRTTMDVEPWAHAALAGARTVWIAGAMCRTGGIASGEAAIRGEPERAGPRPENGEVVVAAADRGGGPRTGSLTAAGRPCSDPGGLAEELARAVRARRGIELAPARDQADLVLYFEQADRLECFLCRQPEDRWYWWGLVLDAAGRELVSLHGESTLGPRRPARRFVASVKALIEEGARR